MPDPIVLSRDQRAFAFDRDVPPVADIDPGAVVVFETGDAAYERLSRGESVDAIGLQNFNAVTGPVRVRGAEPGDAVRVDVLDIRVTRAWSVWLPGFGGLGERTAEMRVMQVPLEDGRARISERLTVPVAPMIGCIGLAPAEGRSSTFMPAYPWGGNMDLREMSPGVTLELPVQVPGALLSVGDLHAAMGAAEPTWVSLEAAGRATLRIGLRRKAGLRFPRLYAEGATLCVGMGETLEAAQQSALNQAYELLTDGFGLEPFAAYAFASARVAMQLGGPASPIVLAVVPDPPSKGASADG
jgi:amidase